MKIGRMSVILGVLLIFITTVSLSGCGSKKQESWAYIHDPETEIISFYDDGKAVYKGETYSFTKDDSYINLKNKENNITSLRYVMEDDKMLLYESSTYEYNGEKTGDGIVGVWKQDNGWSYQFTEDGKFSEENIFFGRYTVDEENSCIRLMYDDPIEDACLYYSLNGDELTIDYPWPMVQTDTGKGEKQG